MDSNSESIRNNAESARRVRNKFRLFGSGIGYTTGFILFIVVDAGIVGATIASVLFAFIGYLFAEIARQFIKSQRNADYDVKNTAIEESDSSVYLPSTGCSSVRLRNAQCECWSTVARIAISR